MGAKRKVTWKIYEKASRELKSPKDDQKVMKKYGLSQSTVRMIRNSYDYQNYLDKSSHNKITINSSHSRQPLTAADRAVIIGTWICVLGLAIGMYLIIKWLLLTFIF